ncbi:MAG: hypothetical protein ABI780_12925 [Ardenticatenales bacterium]
MRRRIAPLAILLGTAALRLWRLGFVPPGFQFDEAHNAIDAARIVNGARPLFLAENGGREALLSYLHAAVLSALGLDHPALALRLVSAWIGIVTVAVVIVAVGRWTGRRALGRSSGAVLAVLYWHVHFSRYGIRTIVAPLWAMLVVWAWWTAVRARPPLGTPSSSSALTLNVRMGRAGARRSQDWAAIACGVALAAAAWSHPTGRLLPLILIAHALWRAAATGGRSARRDARALAVAGATALVLFAPLGLHFLRYPVLFTAHPSDVGLAAVAAKHFDGSIWRAIAGQLQAVAGMFFVAGDPSTFHNLPGRPVFDPLLALAFVVGAGVALAALVGRGRLVRRWREHAVLGSLWLIVGLLPTMLSDRAPNFSRATAALPVVAVLAGVGVWLIGAGVARGFAMAAQGRSGMGRAGARRARGAGSVGVAGLWVPLALVIGGAVFTARDYFGAFVRDPQVYYSYDVEKLDALAALRARAVDASVYLAPLWATHATIEYLNDYAVGAAERSASADFMADVGDASYAGRIIDASGEAGGDGEGGGSGDGAAVPPHIGQLDARQTLVYPDDGRDVIVAMPAREAAKSDWAATVRGFLGDAPSTAEVLDDAQGQPLLSLLRVPAAAFGDLAPPTDAPLEPAVWTHVRFGGGAIDLLGFTAGAARPGEVMPLTVVWRSLEPTAGNLTVFVHLTGPDDVSWGQSDREPGQASYRTGDWRGGEVIIDQYRPTLSAEATGQVTLCLGWYDAATGVRLSTNDGQDQFCPRPIEVVGR